MEKHDLTHLETRVKELCQGLKDVANDTDFQEFLRIIHRPGWTTPAEVAFVGALVDAMHGQAKTLASLKHGLMAGSRVVKTSN